MLILFTLVYLLGMFWYTALKFIEDTVYGVDYSEDCCLYRDHFINYYKLEENSNVRNSIILVYFALSTITTVGFGDFTPRSDIERIIWTVVLFLSAVVFCLMLSQLIKIINHAKKFMEESQPEDEDNLGLFLSVL